MNLATIKYDVLLIRKDPMLMLSMAVPFLLWLVMQFGFPALEQLLLTEFAVDISPFYFHTGIILLMLIPMVFGMVYGFMLLDERDEGIITAISVTPFGRKGYLGLRMAMPMVFTFLSAIIFCLLLGLGGEHLDLWQLLLLSAILTLNAPVLLLFLGAFAGNKVEGMAISKGFGILLSAVIVDFIVPVPWNFLGAFSPLFWLARAFMATQVEYFAIYAGVSLITHGALLMLLYRLFLRKGN